MESTYRNDALQSRRNGSNEIRPAAAESMKPHSQTTPYRRDTAMSILHRYLTCGSIRLLLLSYLSFTDVDRRPPAMACVRWKTHLVGLERFLHRAST